MGGVWEYGGGYVGGHSWEEAIGRKRRKRAKRARESWKQSNDDAMTSEQLKIEELQSAGTG